MNETFDIEKLKPTYIIGGADLSRTTELMFACLMFKVPNDETIYFKHMYWLPEICLKSEQKKIKSLTTFGMSRIVESFRREQTSTLMM